MSNKKKPGRPRKFDEQQVLEKIVLLFWRQGYQATSVDHICQEVGLTKPSLYASFGDKQKTFLKALEHYKSTAPQLCDEFLHSQQPLKTILMTIIERAVLGVPGKRPPGCMLVNASTELGHIDVFAKSIAAGHMANEQGLVNILSKAQTRGQLAQDKDLVALAQHINLLIQGLAVMHRNGRTLTELGSGVDAALDAIC